MRPLEIGDRCVPEAKNSDSKEALRMAIGQLYDYGRFYEPPVRLAVLFLTSPTPTARPPAERRNRSDMAPRERISRLR